MSLFLRDVVVVMIVVLDHELRVDPLDLQSKFPSIVEVRAVCQLQKWISLYSQGQLV